MSEEEKTPWAIRVDETPEPWEDYSYLYSIVVGTKEEVKEYTDELEAKNPEWFVMATNPYVIKEIKYL